MTLDRQALQNLADVKLAPLFAVDRGTLSVLGCEGGIVRVRFGGAYRACPSREILARHVVEPLLRQAFPEISRLEWK